MTYTKVNHGQLESRQNKKGVGADAKRNPIEVTVVDGVPNLVPVVRLTGTFACHPQTRGAHATVPNPHPAAAIHNRRTIGGERVETDVRMTAAPGIAGIDLCHSSH